MSQTRTTRAGRRPSITAPGLLLGLGLGGFVDGIVLHQILQWHHLLTASDTDNVGVGEYPATTVRGLEVNTLWDGLFHATTYAFTAAGLFLLWSRARRGGTAWSWRGLLGLLLGLLLAGWGTFNLVEGLVDHHLLGIHHVRDDVANAWPWDLAFLAFGALLLLGGLALARADERATAGIAGDGRERRGSERPWAPPGRAEG